MPFPRVLLPALFALALACGDDGSSGGGGSATSGGGTSDGGEPSDAHLFCEAHCMCEGCSGTWVDDCAALRAQTRPGCETEWDALYACLVQNMTCNAGSFLYDGCDPEDAALRDCTLSMGSSG